MTIISLEQDQDYTDATISSSEFEVREKDGVAGWKIAFKEEKEDEFEAGFFLPEEHKIELEPKTGDSIRVYGFGAGPVRGVFVNDEEIFYYTEREWQLLAQRKQYEIMIGLLDRQLAAWRDERINS